MRELKNILRATIALMLSGAMLISSPQSITKAAEKADKVSVSLIGKYDSADTAAIRSIDTIKKEIRFRNHSTGKTYTLSYDNTSMMYDERGTVLSAALLEVGEIVDVTFLKSTKHITTLNVSSDAWSVEDTRSHELVRGDGTARIQGDIYKIDARTLVMAEGKLALAEDVLSTDRVTVRGLGKEIYSVVVTGGHGYVSLSSDTVEDHSLVGAWLELDNEVIHKISPNMMLSAPEGDYNLQILGNGANYQTEVNISRNQETVVDTSGVNIERPKESLVTFLISPDDAEVFVDGERYLTDTPQTITYGYHSLKIIADGYETQNKYLKVGTPKAIIQIDLEKESDASDSSATDTSAAPADVGAIAASTGGTIDISAPPANIADIANSSSAIASTVSANSSSEKKESENAVIDGYKIYFDKPYGAELYFDGAYIGEIPTNVTKISGSHEVILKKSGYETKSYRINIDKAQDNLEYTFPDLIKEGGSSDSSSSASSGDSSSGSSSSASTGDSSSGSASSASTGDSSSGSASSASTGDSSSGSSSSASTGDSSSGSASSASTGDSSGSASSASTGDSSSGSASTGDSSAAGSSTNSDSASTEGSSADSSSATSASSADAAPGEGTSEGGSAASTEASTDGGASASKEETPSSTEASSAASEGSETNNEASDAATTASGEG